MSDTPLLCHAAAAAIIFQRDADERFFAMPCFRCRCYCYAAAFTRHSLVLALLMPLRLRRRYADTPTRHAATPPPAFFRFIFTLRTLR